MKRFLSILAFIFVPIRTRNPRLRCDKCNTAVPVDGLSADLIGVPCPLCENPMLTQQDYRAAMRQYWIVAVLNVVLLPLHWLALIVSLVRWACGGQPIKIVSVTCSQKEGALDVREVKELDPKDTL